ncbi:MAG TPA: tetratricopeptide repeat protein [Pirellulales bacterium]|nr:tetratricopeptide repeat protein [Pirellulales bacterium]
MPNSPRRLSARWRWGRGLALCGLLTGGCAALVLYRSPDRHYQRAVAALDDDRPQDSRLETVAYELLEVSSDPAFEAQAGLLSATLLVARGEPKAAIQEAAVAAANPDTKVRAMVLLGRCLYESGQFLEAGETWTKALEIEPDNADAHRWLGAAYYELGAVREALVHLRRAAELRPLDPGPHRLIGQLCIEFWEPKTAIEAYQEALRRAPDRADNDDVRFALAKVFYRTNRHREALELLAQCEASANVIALMAECEHGSGNTERAWSLVNDALRLDLDHVRALGLKGKLLIARHGFAEAAQTLEAAARLSPKDTTVLYDLGIAYHRLGQTERSKEAHRFVDHLRQFQRAYEDLSFQSVEDPRDAQIRYRLGMLAAQLDKPRLARMWLRASVHLDPTNGAAQAALQSLGPETN